MSGNKTKAELLLSVVPIFLDRTNLLVKDRNAASRSRRKREFETLGALRCLAVADLSLQKSDPGYLKRKVSAWAKLKDST